MRNGDKGEENNLLHTQIPGGKDIQPLQGKHGKHLDRPPPQPPHGDQSLEQVRIARSEQHLIAQVARGELLGQPLDILGFALGKARRAKRGEITALHVGGSGEAITFCVLEQADESILD